MLEMRYNWLPKASMKGVKTEFTIVAVKVQGNDIQLLIEAQSGEKYKADIYSDIINSCIRKYGKDESLWVGKKIVFWSEPVKDKLFLRME